MKRRMFCGLAGMAALSGCTEIMGDFSNDQVGHTYSIDDELDLTVDELESQQGGSVVLDDVQLTGGSDSIAFVLPHLVATNPTESTVSVPSFDSFILQSGGNWRDSYRTDYMDEQDSLSSSITEPVSGPLFPSVDEIGPEDEAEGWLVFRVPNPDDSVTLEARIDEEVYQWSLLL